MKKHIFVSLGVLLIGALSVVGCSSPSTSSNISSHTVATKQEKKASNQSKTDVSKIDTSKNKEVQPVTESQFKGYKLIVVDGGDMSGSREPNVVVDIGFGKREYWAFTNQYGQLVKVTAKKIILQDDTTEAVNSNGRYYPDEADVPGTEASDLDKGHVIADSLGGVSNAYNITPQNSTLNRHGDQAYMEKVIRDAGGCTNFEVIITYPNNSTQIPSHYSFTYTLMGKKIHDEFDNVNSDNETSSSNSKTNQKNSVTNSSNHYAELERIDTNGNGIVTIAEAKAAGYHMPIRSTDWLYQYMIDRDGDGLVGE